MSNHPVLLLAGCGKMGGAMLAGWLDGGLPPDHVHIVEPTDETRTNLIDDYGVQAVGDAGDLPEGLYPDIVILAVKPQMMERVAPAYAAFAKPGTVFLSIAAGKTIGVFEGHLGDNAAIIRAMPNTPAAVGRGVTVCVANPHVSETQKALAQSLLEAVGQVGWVDDEALIDAVTGVSGSGPAYVFYMTECLARAGEAAGLPRDLARQLARATVSGSGELMQQSSDEPETLRTNVTSPGGTTAAALDVLMADEDGLADIMARAVNAATARSRELA